MVFLPGSAIPHKRSQQRGVLDVPQRPGLDGPFSRNEDPSPLPTLLPPHNGCTGGQFSPPKCNASAMRRRPRPRVLAELDEEVQLQELGWPPAEMVDFIDKGPVSLRWLGADGTILWANRDELSLLGYQAEEYIGQNVADFYAGQDDLALRLQEGEQVRDAPATMIHRDGSLVYVLVSSAAYCGMDGEFSHTRCFTRNVTSSKLQEVERAKRHAEEKAITCRTTAVKLRRLNQKWRRSAEMNTQLLHQMLPPKVAADLSEGRSVPPEAFDHVTIFFSDIEGFTTISSGVEPIQVVSLLNTLYTVMDYCASLFPVYKVETIGDAYMVVGGLPERSPLHSAAVADFALLVRHLVQLVKNPIQVGSSIRLRMGIHSGPVVAGVVGNLMPRYCLFGDTVNTASRMESTGEAGRIHCSSRVAGTLIESGLYHVRERGSMIVKGKGEMTTYWLEAGSDENEHCQGAYLNEAMARASRLVDQVPLQQTYRMLMQERIDDQDLNEMQVGFEPSPADSFAWSHDTATSRRRVASQTPRRTMAPLAPPPPPPPATMTLPAWYATSGAAVAGLLVGALAVRLCAGR